MRSARSCSGGTGAPLGRPSDHDAALPDPAVLPDRSALHSGDLLGRHPGMLDQDRMRPRELAVVHLVPERAEARDDLAAGHVDRKHLIPGAVRDEDVRFAAWELPDEKARRERRNVLKEVSV